jgi:transposase InsO family protein
VPATAPASTPPPVTSSACATRPYRPRTNGKAERFIKTLTHRWAYGALYADSAERTRALPGWLTYYNFTRRHGALGHRPPAARLNELNNLAGNYN